MNEIAFRGRREFLRFLAASPLAIRAFAQQSPLVNAKDALNVSEFEAAARALLPPAHLGYVLSGVDDDATYRANLEGFKHFQLRPKRLVDVSKPDLKMELFGTIWESPLFLCPVGGLKMFHTDGELGVARAAKAKNATQVLSTVTSYALEDVAKNLGRPPWYQLYMPQKWEDTEKLVRRVEGVGCTVMAWTVDLLGGRNSETFERMRRDDTRACYVCHQNGVGSLKGRPMFEGIDPAINPSSATWETFDRLKKFTKMKLLIKGIDSAEDARLAREHGADGIIVSNHGGRATETGRATIEALGEVVEAAGREIPVLVDGGFRRGTDIYKALAMGAKAVGVGRPYVYGLTAFGQEGVERVIDILRAELMMTMKQCGTPTLKDITRERVQRVVV